MKAKQEVRIAIVAIKMEETFFRGVIYFDVLKEENCEKIASFYVESDSDGSRWEYNDISKIESEELYEALTEFLDDVVITISEYGKLFIRNTLEYEIKPKIKKVIIYVDNEYKNSDGVFCDCVIEDVDTGIAIGGFTMRPYTRELKGDVEFYYDICENKKEDIEEFIKDIFIYAIGPTDEKYIYNLKEAK